MKQYWQNLSERDKKMLIIGVIISLIYISYLLVYKPLTNAITNKEILLKAQTETLSWLRGVKQYRPKSESRKQISTTQLLSILSASINNGIFKHCPHKLQQKNDNEIQLSLKQVPFNNFIKYLFEITTHYQIRIKQFSADNDKMSPGIAKISVVFEI